MTQCQSCQIHVFNNYNLGLRATMEGEDMYCYKYPEDPFTKWFSGGSVGFECYSTNDDGKLVASCVCP